jgi:hypothetical protein
MKKSPNQALSVLLVYLTMSVTEEAFAKRHAPTPVTSILHRGMIYSAPPFIQDRLGKPLQKGGYIEAHEAKTGKLLWRVRIYKTRYNTLLETDVQDVFITKLTLEGDTLIVADEKNRRCSFRPPCRRRLYSHAIRLLFWRLRLCS